MSTFEADLRAVREARGLSLDEIQRDTRIPVDVLRRFEDGGLVGDPSYNPVYLKAFLQSYAKAVGLPVSDVHEAYEAHQRGSYDGRLSPEGAKTPKERAPEPVASPEPPTPTAEEPAPAPSTPAPRSTTPPAVEALASTPSPDRRRPPSSSSSTGLSQTRVSRPSVPTARRSFDKNWGTILGLFGVLAVALGLALWFLVFRGDGEPETDAPTAVAVGGADAPAAVDSSGIGAGAASGGPQLQLPITAAVTAGGDGLQWFRVTEDSGERTPYWIDMGTTQTFTADSSLVLWGEGNEGDTAYEFSETTVEIQGLRFQPRNGAALRIDRQSGQRLLDSLATSAP